MNKFYQYIYAAIRDEEFYTLEKLNNRIYELTDKFNDLLSRTSGKNRRAVFEEQERDCFTATTRGNLRFRYRKEVKPTGDYNVTVGRLEERHFYSVPYTYIGQNVTILWDTETVEIYQNDTRIALHRRCLTGGRTTEEAHMPENHLKYLHNKRWNAAFYLEEAESIGVYTRKVVEKVLDVNHAYRSCEGILTLPHKYGKDRLENACRHVSESRTVTYNMLRNILQDNLHKTEIQSAVTFTPDNEYVCGAEAFANI